jgi:AcrR family transcriptional regulator
MSKATFYAHFSNKLACILALVDRGNEAVAEAMAAAARSAGTIDAAARLRAGTRAYLAAIAEHPDFARTLLVEIVGAGPKAMAKRDQGMQLFAAILDAENAAASERGRSPRFASSYDSYAIVGAIAELVSRHVRLGEPGDVFELGPVIDRLIDGVLARGS